MEEQKVVKSVLRYPGGKSRAVKIIVEYFPKNLKRMASLFLGGASIELFMASQGIKVYGYDVFDPLITFWDELLKNPDKLADRVAKYHPLEKKRFYELQKTCEDIKEDLERAAIFYVLNRSSFSGSTLSGGMSPGHVRFNQASIDRLRNFRVSNFYVDTMDFKDSIVKHKDDFLYLDPPYYKVGGYLYGTNGNTHRGFPHKELKSLLDIHDNWVLSYNDCAYIRELYKNYKIVQPSWAYGMSKKKKSREILILSDGLNGKTNSKRKSP